ncbi:MAG: TolC family protein [Desulfuromonadales bacterium]|nr:MAG: TolC family protein [Desulfuromonadales bacterium]
MKTLQRFLLAGCITMLSLTTASGAEESVKQILSLSDCIRNALTVAPELGESQADIDLMTSKLSEAKAYRYPQIEFLGLIGPAPQARGNQVYSPDGVNDTQRLTWFQRGDATLIQPLYTFGKISENMKAASHGIEVDRAKKEQRRNEVALQVKEYYYGLLLARELKEVVLEVQENLDKARKKARELLDKGSPNVEELDIYKLDAFNGEVGKYLEEAKKGESLALSALKTRVGLPTDAQIDIATERLTPDESSASDLSFYLNESRAKRPEYRQIREGLQARQALVDAAKAAYWPDLFVAGYLSGAHADKRTRIDNPFIRDDFNHFWGGVALGLKWKLDFGITGAKVSGEQAQYNRLLSTKTYAEANIPLQIKKAHLELIEAEKSISSTKEAYTNSKKWIVAALANFDFGIGPAKEVFEGLQNYARMRGGFFQSIYNQKIAKANLEYAIGEMPLEKK